MCISVVLIVVEFEFFVLYKVNIVLIFLLSV